MSYGLQIAASGLMAAMYRQDVFANNLANMRSVGFKADIPEAAPREAERPEDNLWQLPSNAMLEKLGGGVLLRPNRVDFRQGSIRTGAGPLDFAVEGNGFFAVQSGGEELLTRDGRMTRSTGGELVMAATGARVLDDQGNAIALEPGLVVEVGGDGVIRQGGKTVAKLGLREAPTEGMAKVGHGMFRAPEGAARAGATGTIRQFCVEEGAVDEVRALLAVTGATREVQLNAEMMRAHDDMMQRAISSMGRQV